jgi:hypothetical protein
MSSFVSPTPSTVTSFDNTKNDRILEFVSRFLQNRLQHWEHTFLFFDVMELFPHCDWNASRLQENQDDHLQQFCSEFWDLRKTEYHVFDPIEYQQVVYFLVFVAEKLSDNCEDPIQALAIMSVFYERTRTYKLLSFRDDGTVFLNEAVYWAEMWDRDIKGWERAIELAESLDIKEWLGRFLVRAIGYKRDHILELSGGPDMVYDMTSVTQGPFTVVLDG